MTLPILIASSRSEQLAVYRFRYKVYIEEMQKRHVSANHLCKIQWDEADHQAILYYASMNDNIIGTVRLQQGITRFAEKDYELFQIDVFEKIVCHSKLVIVDRLIVESSFRGSSLAHQLMLTCYLKGLEIGTQICFISCEEKLLPMYIRYGFRVYDEPVLILTGELRYRLILVLEDRSHLKKVKSPFLAHLPEGKDDGGFYASLISEKLGAALKVC